MIQSGRFRWLAVLLTIVSSGCSGTPGTSGPAAGPTPASAAEIEAIYRARADSARTRYTEADVRFMTRMIGHHAQALEMARLATDRTEDNQILTLSARIINAQNDEINTMQRWLRDRGQPVPEADHAMDHAAGDMPGMLTPEQMAELEAASGTEFDRLLLTFMIQHHAGAVAMVEELFRTDGAAQDEEVFKFASDAQVDQRTEIERMELMLSQLRFTR
jgi:uncharacterized protein (DUF305 family)